MRIRKNILEDVLENCFLVFPVSSLFLIRSILRILVKSTLQSLINDINLDRQTKSELLKFRGIKKRKTLIQWKVSTEIEIEPVKTEASRHWKKFKNFL